MKRYTVLIDELYITRELDTDDLFEACELYCKLKEEKNNALIWDNEKKKNITDNENFLKW